MDRCIAAWGCGGAREGGRSRIRTESWTRGGLRPLAPGTGLTIVSWLMRLGFLLFPQLVGLIADATTLRAGLPTFSAAGVVPPTSGALTDT